MGYSNVYDNDGGWFLGFIFVAVIVVFSVLFAIALYVVCSWFLMRIFDKAGVQGRWRAWIPVYNGMVFVKLGDMNPWWFLGILVAQTVFAWAWAINWVFDIALVVYILMAAWRVGLKLQKEAVWLVLFFFLPPVWMGILAFDRSRWNIVIPPAPWFRNFLADRALWVGIPSQVPAGGYPYDPHMYAQQENPYAPPGAGQQYPGNQQQYPYPPQQGYPQNPQQGYEYPPAQQPYVAPEQAYPPQPPQASESAYPETVHDPENADGSAPSAEQPDHDPQPPTDAGEQKS